MTTSPPDESWTKDFALLPWLCRNFAQKASTLIRGDVVLEAHRITLDGFVVPSKESLLHAAQVFENIAALEGGVYWNQRPDPYASIHVVCALIGAIDGFEREWDLAALSTWWQFRDTQTMLQQARSVQQVVNAGHLDRVAELLVLDIERADREFGASR